MNRGISVGLTGANTQATAAALLSRLAELNCEVEWMDAALVERLGGPAGAACVCGLLSRHGVVVVVTDPAVRPEGDRMDIRVEAHDTPEFAAEKVLDRLAEEGIVHLDQADYSPEEEEEIRRRLADLGYVE